MCLQSVNNSAARLCFLSTSTHRYITIYGVANYSTLTTDFHRRSQYCTYIVRVIAESSFAQPREKSEKNENTPSEHGMYHKAGDPTVLNSELKADHKRRLYYMILTSTTYQHRRSGTLDSLHILIIAPAPKYLWGYCLFKYLCRIIYRKKVVSFGFASKCQNVVVISEFTLQSCKAAGLEMCM
jgi:hypothetical protein